MLLLISDETKCRNSSRANDVVTPFRTQCQWLEPAASSSSSFIFKIWRVSSRRVSIQVHKHQSSQVSVYSRDCGESDLRCSFSKAVVSWDSNFTGHSSPGLLLPPAFCSYTPKTALSQFTGINICGTMQIILRLKTVLHLFSGQLCLEIAGIVKLWLELCEDRKTSRRCVCEQNHSNHSRCFILLTSLWKVVRNRTPTSGRSDIQYENIHNQFWKKKKFF